MRTGVFTAPRKGQRGYVAGSLEFPHSEQESLLKHGGGGHWAGLWALVEWWGKLTRVVASTVTPCLISTSATGTWPSCATRWRGVSPLWKEKEVHHPLASKELQAIVREHCPGCVAQLVGHHLTNGKVASSISGCGTRLGCGFSPWLGCPTSHLTLSDVLPALSLHALIYNMRQLNRTRGQQRFLFRQGQIINTLDLCLWKLPTGPVIVRKQLWPTQKQMVCGCAPIKLYIHK